MVKKITYLLVFFLSCQLSFAQENSPKKLFKNVNYFLDVGYFEEALDNMIKLYHTDTENPNFNYLLGKCYFNITPKKYEAEPYLLAASNSVSLDYVENDFNCTKASLECFLMLGELYHFDNKLDLAEDYYTRYKEMTQEPEETRYASHLLKSVSRARHLEKTYIPYISENLGEKINSTYSEYNPVFSFDGSTMAFTSFQNSEDVVFLSKKVNGEWESPENISAQIGSNGSCFTAAMSSNGNKLYLICIDGIGSDIYCSEYNGNSWSKMKPFSSKINSAYYETSFYMNATEDLLYFSSDIPNGFGGQDLYFSKKDKDGEWMHPENLGARINSEYNEEYPYLAQGGKLLFFSSNGHETMGGFDVFYSERIGDEVWTKPINAGYPMNTTGNDLAFVAQENGNEGYVVKDLPSGIGNADIYHIKIPEELLFADKLLINESDYSSLVEKTIPSNEGEELTNQSVDSLDSIPNSVNDIIDISKQVSYSDNAVVTPTSTVISSAEAIKEKQPENITGGSDASLKDDSGNDSKPIETLASIKEPTLDVLEQSVSNDNLNKTDHNNSTTSLLKEPVNIKKDDLIDSVLPSSNISKRIFTVQVYALNNHINPNRLKYLGEVKRSIGEDGFARYYIGSFKKYEDAVVELKRVKKLGISDAFIRDTRSISNYY